MIVCRECTARRLKTVFVRIGTKEVRCGQALHPGVRRDQPADPRDGCALLRFSLSEARMQPTGRTGARLRAGGTLRERRRNVGLCGRGPEGLQLMRKSLGRVGLNPQ